MKKSIIRGWSWSTILMDIDGTIPDRHVTRCSPRRSGVVHQIQAARQGQEVLRKSFQQSFQAGKTRQEALRKQAPSAAPNIGGAGSGMPLGWCLMNGSYTDFEPMGWWFAWRSSLHDIWVLDVQMLWTVQIRPQMLPAMLHLDPMFVVIVNHMLSWLNPSVYHSWLVSIMCLSLFII